MEEKGGWGRRGSSSQNQRRPSILGQCSLDRRPCLRSILVVAVDVDVAVAAATPDESGTWRRTVDDRKRAAERCSVTVVIIVNETGAATCTYIFGTRAREMSIMDANMRNPSHVDGRTVISQDETNYVRGTYMLRRFARNIRENTQETRREPRFCAEKKISARLTE